jgi:hypothetical protein
MCWASMGSISTGVEVPRCAGPVWDRSPLVLWVNEVPRCAGPVWDRSPLVLWVNEVPRCAGPVWDHLHWSCG